MTINEQREPTVVVTTHGEISRRDREYAERKLQHLFEHAPGPVLHARTSIARSNDPAVERPVTAKSSIDVNGRLIRAHVAGHDGFEAIDLLIERLDRQVHRLAELWSPKARRAGDAEAERNGVSTWRHGSRPGRRPAFFPRTSDEREIVSKKTFAITPMTPDEAVGDMEMLDHAFYLFVDSTCGLDAVIHERDDGMLGLQRAESDVAGWPATSALEVPHDVVGEPPAARLSLADAVERIDSSGEPFVFFVDETTGRGNVLYHRYDGHYGLITPT